MIVVTDLRIASKPRPIPIERLAWTAMVASFLVFCSLITSAFLGTYSFFFQSSSPMETVVSVARGTAILSDFSERPLRSTDTIASWPSTVSTDSQSQSVLTFYATGDIRRILATITLKNDSQLTLMNAQRPRFEWNDGHYRVDIRGFVGEMDIFINPLVAHLSRFEVQSPQGVTVLLDTAGRYEIRSTDDQVVLSVHEGQAVLLSANLQHNRLVTAEQEAVAFMGQFEPIVRPTHINLLDNGLFSFRIPVGFDENTLPGRWGCLDTQNTLPRGYHQAESWDGRHVLHLWRGEDAKSHGQTGCYQPFGGMGYDVTEYTHIELRTTFLIEHQSLYDCGTDGSECPMMLLMRYTDVNGREARLDRGFFINSNPQLELPPRCISCDQDHQLINPNVWYTFETGNLLTLLPDDERPAYINEIRFYGSGHEYDVHVGEVMLLAGVADVRLPAPVPNAEREPIDPTASGE